MKIALPKKNKIFLYFLCGIALPCLLLSYFALRGIQNDRALLEKQTRERYQRTSQIIMENFHQQIFEVEDSCRKSIQAIANKLDSEAISSLSKLKNKFPLVEEFFYITYPAKINFPIAQLLYTPDNSSNQLYQPKKPSVISNLIAEAQQYEFHDKDYKKAIIIYQRALNQNVDKAATGELLNAIARVQKKLSRFNKTILCYQELSTNYQHTITASGVPLGLAARVELGSLYLTIKDSSHAIETYLDTFRDLIHVSWKLEKTQYSFFFTLIENTLERIFSKLSPTSYFFSYINSFKALKQQAAKLQAFTERMLAFQQEAGQFITEKYLPDDKLNHQLAIMVKDREHLISLLNQPIESNGRIWAILWNIDHLKDSLLTGIINEHSNLQHSYWQIINREGGIITKSDSIASDKLMVRSKFINNFPPWSIEIYQSNPLLLEYIFTSQRGIYLYIFILIAGILIFGLVLTIRSVAHELELAKLKSDFVSTVSHEFRSPLTSIRQLAEMLQQKRVPSEERRQKYYDVIVEQSERLSLLINNVLDFARLEEGRKQFYFEMINIEELLRNIVTSFQHHAQYEGFELKTDIAQSLPEIKADRSAITQAIANLLDNAIKYSAAVKTIHIRAYVKNQYLFISIQDYGIGIKKEDLKKIFERFYRGRDEAIRDRVKGTGLGLTLVKQIVEKHQGSIYVESKPGKGSIFTIKLPV